MIRFPSALRRSKPDIAVDFGTSNLRLVSRDGGIIFDEPSLCCFSRQDGVTKFVAAGAAVRAMLDRTPRGLTIKHPLCRGVLQDIEAAKELLRFALSQTRSARSVRSPSALIGIPADATQAERSAMLTAANDAGFGAVELISEPLAAAIVVEDDERGSLTQATYWQHLLRSEGFTVEVFASGSPRKRYDKAVKLSPSAILKFRKDGHGFSHDGDANPRLIEFLSRL